MVDCREVWFFVFNRRESPRVRRRECVCCRWKFTVECGRRVDGSVRLVAALSRLLVRRPVGRVGCVIGIGHKEVVVVVAVTVGCFVPSRRRWWLSMGTGTTSCWNDFPKNAWKQAIAIMWMCAANAADSVSPIRRKIDTTDGYTVCCCFECHICVCVCLCVFRISARVRACKMYTQQRSCYQYKIITSEIPHRSAAIPRPWAGRSSWLWQLKSCKNLPGNRLYSKNPISYRKRQRELQTDTQSACKQVVRVRAYVDIYAAACAALDVCLVAVATSGEKFAQNNWRPQQTQNTRVLHRLHPPPRLLTAVARKYSIDLIVYNIQSHFIRGIIRIACMHRILGPCFGWVWLHTGVCVLFVYAL